MQRPARTTMVVLVLTMLALSVPAVGVSAAGASAPAGTEEKATTYVGTVEGVGSLGIVVDDDGAFGYLCDSADVTQWFKGTNKGGKLDLQSPDGSLIAAGVKGKKVDGIYVSADGTSTDFVLKQATGDAGLFRQEQIIDGNGYAAGWVVLADGTTDGQVSNANLPGGRALVPPGVIITDQGIKVDPSEVVGLPAPPAIKAVFPATPPPADQVVVVPFTTGTTGTDQAPGGSGTGSDQEPGGGGLVTSTTVVPTACVDIDGIKKQISALQAALEDAGLLKRRSIKQQIGRLQQELENAQGAPNGGCTLPLQ